MNQIKCANCSFLNASNMNFCTSCGKGIFPTAQSSIPTVEKVVIAQDGIQQRNFAPKSGSNSKFWIGGLLGCLGLVGLVAIGAVFLSIFSQLNSGSLTTNNNQNTNKTVQIKNGKKDETVSVDNSKTTPDDEIKTDKSDSSDLIEILKDHQEVGKFKQLTAKVVNVDEFFYYAKDAANSSYHNGSQYVSLTIGRFENFDDAKKNFNEQFANVKKKGGRTQILETSIDGTINGVYQAKGFFTAEYCTKSSFCYRMVSKDPKALKYFIENFIKL
jgi:hypothetical protein